MQYGDEKDKQQIGQERVETADKQKTDFLRQPEPAVFDFTVKFNHLIL